MINSSRWVNTKELINVSTVLFLLCLMKLYVLRICYGLVYNILQYSRYLDKIRYIGHMISEIVDLYLPSLLD